MTEHPLIITGTSRVVCLASARGGIASRREPPRNKLLGAKVVWPSSVSDWCGPLGAPREQSIVGSADFKGAY